MDEQVESSILSGHPNPLTQRLECFPYKKEAVSSNLTRVKKSVQITNRYRCQTHYLDIEGSNPSCAIMSTLNQIIRNPRKKPKKKSRVPAFKQQPFAKGICLKSFGIWAPHGDT